jgi:hypothetical protein
MRAGAPRLEQSESRCVAARSVRRLRAPAEGFGFQLKAAGGLEFEGYRLPPYQFTALSPRIHRSELKGTGFSPYSSPSSPAHSPSIIDHLFRPIRGKSLTWPTTIFRSRSSVRSAERRSSKGAPPRAEISVPSRTLSANGSPGTRSSSARSPGRPPPESRPPASKPPIRRQRPTQSTGC